MPECPENKKPYGSIGYRNRASFLHRLGLVAHDHHNLVAIGVDDASILTAARRVAELGGGLVAARGGEVLAELARAAGVGTLVLTHVSRRYSPRDVLAEARAVFPATRLAEDLDRYQVRRGSVARVRERLDDRSTCEPMAGESL